MPATGPDPVRVFIGYDPRQNVSFFTLVRSIMARTKQRVSIEPLILDTLPIKRAGLTPFTYSRFLVPWLCNYQGWAIFLDSDEQVIADIGELWALRDDKYSMMTVKHGVHKVNGREDSFEWENAAVMLMNCAKLTTLTPSYVQTTSDPLHRICFVSPDQHGELPADWNFLVGYEQPRPGMKLLHYTQGVPVWPETQGDEWTQTYAQDANTIMSAEPWVNLMGNSRHALPVYERLVKRMGAAQAAKKPVAAPEQP